MLSTPHVPLHADATRTAVDAFGQPLARHGAAQTSLREPERRRDDERTRAGAFSLAHERRHKRRRGCLSHGLSIAFLEALVAVLFDADVVAEPQQGIGKLPVETLVVGRFPAFDLG